ncbi:amidohydrolase family protein [Halomonas sp. C05BenzN]|uniref:amidohydrolase family protein n=1 Tax=Halomonas sp. C05BenzN TaxID=3411041 RepID=UPI003B95003D
MKRPTGPEGSAPCDCHAHIFGPASRYPLDAGADYRPAEASVDDYRSMLDRLGLAHCVLVQPSIYGTDNRCLIDALRTLGDRARGVAVIAPDIAEQELLELHMAGVRGIRLNTAANNGTDLDALEPLTERIRPLGWHIQVLLTDDTLVQSSRRLERLGCDVVVDHFALLDPRSFQASTGFRKLLDLLSGGHAWVKLSAPYLQGATTIGDFRAFSGLAQALSSARPDRLLWATDWPHPAFRGEHLDDRELLDLLVEWIPDPSTRRLILEDNPQALYKFIQT